MPILNENWNTGAAFHGCCRNLKNDALNATQYTTTNSVRYINKQPLTRVCRYATANTRARGGREELWMIPRIEEDSASRSRSVMPMGEAA